MDVQVEKVSDIERRIQVTIPSKAVNLELNKEFNRLQRQVRMQGFRPGKVPRRIVEQRFGKSVRAQVASQLINEAFQEAAGDIEFFGRPKVDQGDLKKGADFSFSITVEVKPELELAPYKGVKVDYPVAPVPDAQVEAQIASRLQSQASMAAVEGRAVESGDFVLAGLGISDGGESVHEHPGTMINTSGDSYYGGVEALLVGAELGEEREGEVTFSEDAQIEELAGRTLQVKAKVESIQAMKAPELSDEIAGELGYEGGAEGMRAAIRATLQESADAQARNQARANLLQVLIDANDFKAPAGLVDQQLEALLEELRVQRIYRGEDPRKIQWSDAQMRDYRSRATFAAKASLILDQVSSQEEISVADEELEAKYQEIADARGQQVEAIRGYFMKEDAVEELRARLLEEKTLDWLLEQAELVEVSQNDDVDGAAVEASSDDAAPEAAEAAGEE